MRYNQEKTPNRLRLRGAIDDNWDRTIMLYERLRKTGLCRQLSLIDDDWEEYYGVTFLLNEHEGTIDIHDSNSQWGPIGTWNSEVGFYVLCMENHKRPFHKQRSITDAVEISLILARLPPEQRDRFRPTLRVPYAGYGD